MHSIRDIALVSITWRGINPGPWACTAIQVIVRTNIDIQKKKKNKTIWNSVSNKKGKQKTINFMSYLNKIKGVHLKIFIWVLIFIYPFVSFQLAILLTSFPPPSDHQRHTIVRVTSRQFDRENFIWEGKWKAIYFWMDIYIYVYK